MINRLKTDRERLEKHLEGWEREKSALFPDINHLINAIDWPKEWDAREVFTLAHMKKFHVKHNGKWAFVTIGADGMCFYYPTKGKHKEWKLSEFPELILSLSGQFNDN